MLLTFVGDRPGAGGSVSIALGMGEGLLQLADVAEVEPAHRDSGRLASGNLVAPQPVWAASARLTARSSRQRAPRAMHSAMPITNWPPDRPRARFLRVRQSSSASGTRAARADSRSRDPISAGPRLQGLARWADQFA